MEMSEEDKAACFAAWDKSNAYRKAEAFREGFQVGLARGVAKSLNGATHKELCDEIMRRWNNLHAGTKAESK